MQNVRGLCLIRITAFRGYGDISHDIIRLHAALYEQDDVISSPAVRHAGLCYISYLSFVSFWEWGRFVIYYGSQE